MSRLAHPAARLAAGSAAVARRLGDRIATWVARGRRHDLTGWRAALGCWLRIAGLLLGVYLLWRLVRAVPALMWLLSATWTVASWRAGKHVEGATPEPNQSTRETPAKTSEMPPRALLILWLDHLTQDRAGIHLDELHAILTRHPEAAHVKRPSMRAWLDRHHITVDRTLRVGAVAGRSGVSRATIEALLKTLPPLAESSDSPPLLHADDQGVSPAESGVESTVEPGVDPYFDDVVRLFA